MVFGQSFKSDTDGHSKALYVGSRFVFCVTLFLFSTSCTFSNPATQLDDVHGTIGVQASALLGDVDGDGLNWWFVTEYHLTFKDSLNEVEEINCDFMYCDPGDLDGDGEYTYLDIIELYNCVSANSCSNMCRADLNNYGAASPEDFNILYDCIEEETCGDI